MEKNVWKLLQSQKRTPEENYLLINELAIFFKPVFTQFDLYAILSNLHLSIVQPQQKIFDEGQKIRQYILLVEGKVNLTKKFNNSDKNSQQNILSGPTVIGQYFYNRSHVREKKAESDEEGALIIKINKKLFDETYNKQIKEYRFLQSYIEKHFGDLSKEKINIYEEFQIIAKSLNAHITPNDQLYIILRGQCLLSQKKKMKKVSNHLQSHSVEKQSELKIIQSKKMLILGENQWIYEGSNRENQYKVVSQKMTLLRVPLNLLPEVQQKAQKIQWDRIKRNKKTREICLDQNQSQKPFLFKKRQKQSQEILNSIDPSLNPAILRKKYLLGYSKFSNHEKVRHSMNLPSLNESQLKKKQRVSIDLQPKGKDWTRYLKLPEIKEKHQNINGRQKIIITSIKN